MRILQVDRVGSGLPCIMHGGSDSLRLKQTEKGWYWTCFGCRRNGDIISAMAILTHKTDAEIIVELRDSGRYEELRDGLAKRALPQTVVKRITVPVPDVVAASDIIEKGMIELESSWEYVSKFNRKITPDIAERFMVGFRRELWLPRYSYALNDAWVFPIPAEKGNIVAIKFHLESPTYNEKGELLKGKSRWAPIGTVPVFDGKNKPMNHYFTWWPHPSTLDKNKPIFIQPGEHKMFALWALGRQATCRTEGENFRWTIEDCKLFAGCDVYLGYDDDDDKMSKDGSVINTGHTFRDEAVKALYPYVNSLRVIHLGKLRDYGQ